MQWVYREPRTPRVTNHLLRTPGATHTRADEHRGCAVNDEVEELGPIDYLVVEFPGNRMTGEGLPLLVDLVDRGLIRILDLTFVRKEEDGSVSGLEIADLTGDGELDLAVFEGASSGLLGQDDIEEAASALEPGSSMRRPDLREPLGRALRRSSPPRRRQDGRLRADPGACHPGRARQHGSRSLSGCRQPPTSRRETAMPGLLRGVARTAVVAGTATAVSNRVSRRQQGRWAAQQEYETPAPPPRPLPLP